MVTPAKGPQVHEPEQSLLAREQAEDNVEERPIIVDELIEELIRVPSTTHSANIPVRIARRILAFYDWYLGPTVNKPERMRATLVDVENITSLKLWAHLYAGMIQYRPPVSPGPR